MNIETYRITTAMCMTNETLPFLTSDEHKVFNNIGYSNKDLDGNKTTRTEYLNSLNKGRFNVDQTKCDNGDFEEIFTITRVTSK